MIGRGTSLETNKILLVEDDDGIRELLQFYLENRDYIVITAEDGESALEIVAAEKPNITLLDIEMPGMNGFEVCQQIREASDIPILFISCRADVMDKIKSFELGGDDYLTKPFDFAELEARIKANLRRYQQKKQKVKSVNRVLKYGELEIHLNNYKCYLHGEEIHLSTKEAQILVLLAKRPNQVWNAEQLYDQIWGFETAGHIQTVKVHISNLRKKLEEDPAKPKYIQTLRGFGYLFAN